MLVFFVLCYDGQDAEAPARRLAVRQKHLERMVPAVTNGSIVSGGAILDEHGHMVGSAFMAKMNSREALDAWIREDPYTLGNVWQRFEICQVRLVVDGGKVVAG